MASEAIHTPPHTPTPHFPFEEEGGGGDRPALNLWLLYLMTRGLGGGSLKCNSDLGGGPTLLNVQENTSLP